MRLARLALVPTVLIAVSVPQLAGASTQVAVSGKLTTTTTTRPTTTTTASVVNPEPVAANDETWKAQAIVNAKCASGGVADLGSKSYLAGDTLVLDGCRDLIVQNGTLDGRAPRGDRRHIDVRGGSNITFRNFTVLGAGQVGGLSTREHEYGIHLRGVAGFTLDGCTIRDVGSDFVNVTGQGKVLASTNVVIKNCTLDRAGRQGVAGSGAFGLNVEGNRIRGVQRVTFDFEAEDGGGHDVVIKNNDITQDEHNHLYVRCVPENSGPFQFTGNRIYGRALSVGGRDCVSAQVTVGGNTEKLALSRFPNG